MLNVYLVYFYYLIPFKGGYSELLISGVYSVEDAGVIKSFSYYSHSLFR